MAHGKVMSLGQSIWIGACQCFRRFFPGFRDHGSIARELAEMSAPAALEFCFLSIRPWRRYLLRLLKIADSKGENPSAYSQIDAHGMGGFRNWNGHIFYRGVWFRGVVDGLVARGGSRRLPLLPDTCGAAWILDVEIATLSVNFSVTSKDSASIFIVYFIALLSICCCCS